MISYRTVLVLGAGASMTFGFPSGFGLLKLVTSQSMLEQLLALWPKEQDVRAFHGALRQSGHVSVDAFLEHRPEYLEIGKLAIARALIPYENSETLFERTQPHLYDHILKAMGAPKQSFSANRLTVVTFNYDRSFEFYLRQSLRHRYGLEGAALDSAAATVPVLHVYGSLGTLSQRSYDSRSGLDELNTARAALRVIHERQDRDEVVLEAQEALEDAERIAFLGFGFDTTNMRRLRIRNSPPTKMIVGSAFGMTDLEKEHARTSAGFYMNLGTRDQDALMTLRTFMILDDDRPPRPTRPG